MVVKDLFGRKIPTYDADLGIWDVKNELLAALGYSEGKIISNDYSKVIFLVLDGLSYEMAKKTRLKGFSLHRARSTVPSSTAAALTTLLTGLMPAEHGILEAKFFLPELGSVYNVLNNSLSYGLAVDINKEFVTLAENIFQALPVKSFAFENVWFSSQIFSEILMGGAKKKLTYSNFIDAVLELEKLMKNEKEAFAYLYLPDPDMMLHLGKDEASIKAYVNHVIGFIEERLSNLKDTLLVVASDHGMTKISKPVMYNEFVNRFFLRQDYAGGHRDVFLYVKDTYYDAILEMLDKRTYRVFNGIELIESGLMGEVVWEETEERIPDIAVFFTGKEGVYASEAFARDHGGLREEEMIATFAFKEIRK